MSWAYPAALLVSLACMLMVDRRFRLFFWADARSAAIVTLAGTVFLLAWDAVGIVMGLFLRGDSPYATGIVVAPHMPIEEPLFLVFLVVCTMILYTGIEQLLARRRATERQS